MEIKEDRKKIIMDKLFADINSYYIKGYRKSLYYNLRNDINKNGISDENMMPFVEQLKIDIIKIKENKED